MGRRRKGVQVGLRDELIFPAPPTDLSRFGAWPEVSEPGLGFAPNPVRLKPERIAPARGEDRPWPRELEAGVGLCSSQA